MLLLINIPKNKWETIQNGMYCGLLDGEMYQAIKHGQPLPDDCEILTKEAYADLCNKAAGLESEVSNE